MDRKPRKALIYLDPESGNIMIHKHLLTAYAVLFALAGIAGLGTLVLAVLNVGW